MNGPEDNPADETQPESAEELKGTGDDATGDDPDAGDEDETSDED